MIDPKHKPYILHSLKQTRREVCSKSIWVFAKTYLPEVFQLPPSMMHTEVSSLLEKIIKQHGTRLAIAGPCDYGLSDLTCLAYVLRASNTMNNLSNGSNRF